MARQLPRQGVIITVVSLLALLLTAVTPRQVRADGNYDITGGYVLSSTAAGNDTPFSLYVSHDLVGTKALTTTISFPAGTTLTAPEAVGAGCSVSAVNVAGPLLNMVMNAGPSGCAFGIMVTLVNPGEYTQADHSVTISTDNQPGTILFIDFEITVTGDPATPPEEEQVVEAVCDQTPDMAVSPELINLAPGGTATVDVTLRNLCKDARFNDSDLLVSLSDGLTVVGGSAGLLNLGQRAAWQSISLAPDETRTWSVNVSAAAVLTAAPQHVSELYYRGRVASRIDGVFIAPAPAPVVEAAPAPAPAPAPADVAIPVVLPNTAGETAGSAWLLTAALLTAVGGVSLLLVRRRS